MAEPIRSFLAFDIDNESVLKRMAEAQILIVKTAADLKLVDPKNIHVTVRFLGNVNQDMIEKIYAEMKSVQFVPFNIKICGLGAFPDVRYPRVCWAGITEGSTELRGIFGQLEPRLQGLGFPAEPRGFSPHLTIARVRSGRNKAELERVIRENVNFDFGVIKGECLKLKKSELTPKGPIYSTLKEFSPTG